MIPGALLAREDLALVERDGAIPGLPVVLSNEALSSMLGEEVVVTRVRYKRGRSIVAAWSSGDHHGWVGAYREQIKVDNAVKAAERAGVWAMVPDAHEHVVATDVWGDRAVSRSIKAVRRRRPGLLDDAELLRHNPSRRQVWRTDAGVLRVGTDRVARRHALVAALTAHDVPLVQPKPVTGVPTAELVPWWGAGDLAAHPTVERAYAAGRAVALLHGVPLARGSASCEGSLPTAAWAAALLELEPAWRERVIALRSRIEDALRSGSRSAPVRLHGDLSADQILIEGDDVSLIDLDRAGAGVAEQDLGSFAAAANLNGLHGLVAPFLNGYVDTGGQFDPAPLAAWQAVSLAQRAVEPFRRRDNGWLIHAGAALTAAEKALA